MVIRTRFAERPRGARLGGRRGALRPTRERGALMVELLVAMALLTGALLPIAYSVGSEKRLARAYYQRAVAMEIVDGEIEALAAGEWRAFQPGTHDYAVQALAATNLPAGRFLLTVEAAKIRLEWRPAVKHHGGNVVREVGVK
jgi:Tfp pilus assembly protein PilX